MSDPIEENRKSNSKILVKVTRDENSVQQGSEYLISKEKLAKKLDISVSMVNKLMSEGLEPRIRIGRSPKFILSEVMGFLERRQK